MTITRTFISVVNSLIESFSFLDSEKTTFKTVREDLIVKNLLGKSVTVDLFDVQLALVSQGAGNKNIVFVRTDHFEKLSPLFNLNHVIVEL